MKIPKKTAAASAMNSPMCRPCSSGSPQNTCSLRARHDVVGHRDVGLPGVLQRASEAEEVDAHPDRDPVEHDRRDHLVRARRGAQDPRDPAPQRAARQRGEDRQDDVQELGHAVERRADPHRRDRAGDVLPLAADVEQAGAEGQRDGEAGEDERPGLQQRLLEVHRRDGPVRTGDPGEEPLKAGALPDRVVRRQRVAAGDEHHQAAQEEGDDRGEDGHEPAAGAQVVGDARPHAGRRGRRLDGLGGRGLDGRTSGRGRPSPPVISRPISSSVAVGGSSPTIRPA